MTDKTHYGVKRLILINSGRYGFAEVDLQVPVHLAAGNNQGKTTLVNALQFLYINDLGNMKFPNTDEETTRHYFGGRNSYLIFECSTFAGLKSILLRGLTKLQSGRYERYSYYGGFRREDYLDQDSIKDFDDVRRVMADRHFTKIANSELWQTLSGKSNRKGETSGSVKILPVKDEEAYRDFCRVYKKLLTLADLDSSALRDLVISCHSRSIGPKKIDIATDYRDEFERAERQEFEFNFVRQAVPLVEAGIAARKTVDELTQKLVESVPRAWAQAYKVIQQVATIRLKAECDSKTIEKEFIEANSKRDSLNKDEGRVVGALDSQIAELTALKEEHRDHWSSYSDDTIQTIEQNAASLQLKIVKLEATLKKIERLDTDTLQRGYNRKQQTLENNKKTLANWESSFGAFLKHKGFKESELQQLFKLVNPSACGAIVGDQIQIKDEKQLIERCRQLLKKFEATHFVDKLIQVDVASFSSIPIEELQDSNSLAQRIQATEQSLAEDQSKLDTALNRKKRRGELARMKTSFSETQTELGSYRQFKNRWDKATDLEEQIEKSQKELKEVKSSLRDIETKISELDSKKSSVQQTVSACHQLKQDVKDAFGLLNRELAGLGLDSQTIPLSSELDTVNPSEDKTEGIAVVANLASEVIDSAGQLTKDAQTISKADDVVKKSEAELQTLSRKPDFVGQELLFDNRAEEWDGLAAKVASLDVMQSSLENAWDALFKTLSGRLNGILQGVNEVKKAVRRISSGLKTFQVSNLQSVELRVETDSSIYPVVDEICRQDGLFQNRDELENAKKRLQSWIKVAKVITIDSMFSLKISGTEADGTPINASSLDKIGSTGTGITVKAMILCQLMRALVPDENYHLHFFIDETGRLDDSNLSATVKMATKQSVIPITAEPKIKLESLAHPEVMIYSLGTTSDGKWFKIDSKRSFQARRVNTDKAGVNNEIVEQDNVAS